MTVVDARSPLRLRLGFKNRPSSSDSSLSVFGMAADDCLAALAVGFTVGLDSALNKRPKKARLTESRRQKDTNPSNDSTVYK